nr:hypothetical protein [Solobacterium sp.]
MKAIRRMTQTVAAVLLIFSMTVLHISAAPAYDAERNEENVRELLEEYDPEGYYIIQTTIEMGGSPISKYLGSNPSLPRTVDTVVHEMFHNYTYVKNGSSKQFRESGPFDTKDFKTLEDWDNFFNSFTVNIETIYMGKEKGDVIIEYPYADSANYKSENFAKNLPEELRTFRYDTYVCENAVASANIDGVYGLINEYGAYHWGFHNQLALYPYYKANSGYEDFFSGCMTNYQAYEEFRFWFLGLLN